MGKLNFNADEATLLKAYGLSTLSPKKWEEVDHDLENSLAGALTGSSASADGDPLGLGSNVDLKNMDLESRAAVTISSKSFDPKTFLSIMHPEATYQDLVSGIAHLRSALDSRSEAIRVLVEENFDRFVAVKASTDALYAEMKEGLLAPSTELGSKPIRDHLKLGAQKSDQIFLPILENASKASKLRATLGVFERSRFFFNLPGFLVESIEAGRYDVALRDYKKGKFLLESRPGQLLPLPTSTAGNVKEIEAQQKRILDKVWTSVEKAMGDMRDVLLGRLKDEGRSVEEHERTIEILLELDTTGDPIWTYFDAQHKFIKSQMTASYDNAVSNIKTVHQRTTLDAPQSLNELLTNQLQSCVTAVDGKMDIENVIAQSLDHEIWGAITDMVKSVSEVMMTHLPNFWRIAKNFLDGKYKRQATGGGTRRSPTQVRSMSLDVIKLYISLLSEFFALSDITLMISSKTPCSPLPFLPLHSNVYTTGHHLSKILSEVQDLVNEVAGMDISNEAEKGLKSLLDGVRWRFMHILISAWSRDATIFHNLETWIASPSEPSITLYLNLIEKFQRHVTTTAFKLAGGVDRSLFMSRGTKQNAIGPAFTSKIIKAFFEVMYALLDGFVHLASDDSPVAMRSRIIKRDLEKRFVSDPSVVAGTNKLQLLDLTNVDVRLLIVISNLRHLVQTLIPDMVNQMESAFGIAIHDDRIALTTAVQDLDTKLFQTYIKPKIESLLTLFRAGILDPNIDWFDMPQPKEIRPYMFETLLYLVGIHAQVSATAESLLDEVLYALVDALAEDAFQAFRTVKKFGMGGMLRATLEIEFMHERLSRYVTPSAAKTLSEAYNNISQAYTRRPGDENLQANLDGVKKTLSATRRATGIEFLCFRQARERGGSTRTKDRDKESSGRSRKE